MRRKAFVTCVHIVAQNNSEKCAVIAMNPPPVCLVYLANIGTDDHIEKCSPGVYFHKAL